MRRNDGVVLNYPNNIKIILFVVVIFGKFNDIFRVISFRPLVVYITINEHHL